MGRTDADSRATVLHLCEHFGGAKASLHGVARAFQWWIPALNDAEFRVLLCSRKGPDAAAEQMRDRGLDPMFLGHGKMDPRNLFALLRILRREGVDLLHAHGYGACLWARVAGHLTGTPVIVHVRCNYGTVPRFQRPVERLLGPFTRKVFAVSESTRDFAIRHRYFHEERVEVLYNGVPAGEFTRRDQDWVTEHRESFGCGAENPVVGIVGRLEAHKGHRDAFAAMERLKADWPTLRLWVVGDGEEEAALREEVNRRGLEEMVVFTGFLPDVRDWMQCFDIMLFPSHREGTPNSLFEAFHTGRCIVASRADGQGEILRNQMNALLFEPGDVDGMTEALDKTLKTPELRELLSSAAERMSAEYDGSACLQRMREVYREMIDDRSDTSSRES